MHFIQKTIPIFLTLGLLSGSLYGCQIEASDSIVNASNFDTYVSNTVVSTGANTAIAEADSVTYRAWFPVEASGEYEYCFYFSNVVDSTWDDGSTTYAGMEGGAYTIESAKIYDAGTNFDANIEPSQSATITFENSPTKSVDPNETFWCDPVTFSVEEGHYLLWEWTVSGTNIPAICMSNMTYAYADQGDGKGFIYTNEIPLPKLLGVKRDVTQVVTLGDSVTQGCQTSDDAYQFWASQLYNQLDFDQYALWNCGLGYARASDCASGGDWLQRATQGADIITVAFATNDIISGAYNGAEHSSADEIEASVRTILQACSKADNEIILWNSPPFDLTEELDFIRQSYNEKVPALAEEFGGTTFDCASLLADPTDEAKTVYGQHPGDEGCTIIADNLAPIVKAIPIK